MKYFLSLSPLSPPSLYLRAHKLTFQCNYFTYTLSTCINTYFLLLHSVHKLLLCIQGIRLCKRFVLLIYYVIINITPLYYYHHHCYHTVVQNYYIIYLILRSILDLYLCLLSGLDLQRVFTRCPSGFRNSIVNRHFTPASCSRSRLIPSFLQFQSSPEVVLPSFSQRRSNCRFTLYILTFVRKPYFCMLYHSRDRYFRRFVCSVRHLCFQISVTGNIYSSVLVFCLLLSFCFIRDTFKFQSLYCR